MAFPWLVKCIKSVKSEIEINNKSATHWSGTLIYWIENYKKYVYLGRSPWCTKHNNQSIPTERNSNKILMESNFADNKVSYHTVLKRCHQNFNPNLREPQISTVWSSQFKFQFYSWKNGGKWLILSEWKKENAGKNKKKSFNEPFNSEAKVWLKRQWGTSNWKLEKLQR